MVARARVSHNITGFRQLVPLLPRTRAGGGPAQAGRPAQSGAGRRRDTPSSTACTRPPNRSASGSSPQRPRQRRHARTPRPVRPGGDLAPGVALTTEMLRAAIDERLGAMNLLGPMDRYKARWTAELRPASSLTSAMAAWVEAWRPRGTGLYVHRLSRCATAPTRTRAYAT